MSKKISLQKIIEVVLEEKGMCCDESNVRSLRRSFDRLLEKLGGSKEVLKSGGAVIGFDESEVPFMKAIMVQLYDKQGLLAKIIDTPSAVSSKDVHDLIQSMIDAESDNGASDEKLINLACFLSNTFHCWRLYSFEKCHTIINKLFDNMQELPETLQAKCLLKVEHVLQKEFALRIVEMTTGILYIAQMIEYSKQDYGDDVGIQNYAELDPEIRSEYIQRDMQVLARIQEDDDLRCYIEKKIGKRAEDIFNYAALSCKM